VRAIPGAFRLALQRRQWEPIGWLGGGGGGRAGGAGPREITPDHPGGAPAGGRGPGGGPGGGRGPGGGPGGGRGPFCCEAAAAACAETAAAAAAAAAIAAGGGGGRGPGSRGVGIEMFIRRWISSMR